MRSAAFRRATSFIDFDGQKFRLTADFKADLALKISAAQDMETSAVTYLRSDTDSIPMTYSELITLRDKIVDQDTAAHKAEFAS